MPPEPRPAKFPEYARNDVVDPTSSVNNVVEPSESKKDLGHGPLGEFPSRQYFNWLHRLTYKWLKYFDNQNITDTFGCKTRSGDFDAVYNFTIRYTVIGDLVIIFFPELIETSAAVTTRIQPEEESEFPSIIMPENDLYIPCITMSDTTTEKPGYLRIETATPSSDWRFRIADSSSVIFDNFSSSGDKGWRAQCLMYKKNLLP